MSNSLEISMFDSQIQAVNVHYVHIYKTHFLPIRVMAWRFSLPRKGGSVKANIKMSAIKWGFLAKTSFIVYILHGWDIGENRHQFFDVDIFFESHFACFCSSG